MEMHPHKMMQWLTMQIYPKVSKSPRWLNFGFVLPALERVKSAEDCPCNTFVTDTFSRSPVAMAFLSTDVSCGVSWTGCSKHCIHAQLWYLPKCLRIMGCLCLAKGTPGDSALRPSLQSSLYPPTSYC